MRPAIDLLSQYAEYHRDRRNIASHFVGIPMIVFSVGVLLAKPAFMVGPLALSPAWLVFVGVAVWYLTRGSLVLGLATSLAVGALILAAHRVGGSGTGAWLAWGLSFFVVGWAIQFVGHWYEGRRPAYADDALFLLVGPMFVVAEALFALGWGKPLLAEITRRAGPTHLRDLARIA